MRIGLISDTHGDVFGTQAAVHQFQAFEVDLVIHMGDVGEGILGFFSDWPTHFVAGNTDYTDSLGAAIDAAGQTFHGRFGQLEIDDRRIAFLHGDDIRRLNRTIESGQWSFVFHGHTHFPRDQRAGDTRVVNPGAIHRAHRPSVAILELDDDRVTHVALA